MTTEFQCVDCEKTKPVATSGGTGYAVDSSGNKVCYECCAIRDRKEMSATGRATLYLSEIEHGGPWQVGNWPGTLSFTVAPPRVSRHNIAVWRYDVWFKGPDGFMWHGVTYGDNTQICHCRRTKEKMAA